MKESPIVKTLEQKEKDTDYGISTYYLDKLENDQYQISQDEFIHARYNTYQEAKEYFDLI